ncbi:MULTISPECIES: hypothetical protein [unclassified Streptomyces]|uniref:hypothetical protein n=1 Tax=unclassified Streptomyces TaxID=2593676 RepID=UPI0033C76086
MEPRKELTELDRGEAMQTTQAPTGYAMPKAAADLVEHATAYGWKVKSVWGKDSGGAPFVTVMLGRLLTGPELTMWGGDRWEYRITWHGRGLPVGRLRLFGGWAVTPESPATHNLPSVKAIREVVMSNPAAGRKASTAVV